MGRSDPAVRKIIPNNNRASLDFFSWQKAVRGCWLLRFFVHSLPPVDEIPVDDEPLTPAKKQLEAAKCPPETELVGKVTCKEDVIGWALGYFSLHHMSRKVMKEGKTVELMYGFRISMSSREFVEKVTR